ncbi:MAG: hypothetical protein WDO14_02510 [Bacteroidota bacterium]
MNTDSSYRKYAPFWSKYRPAILKMMQGSVDESQQYQFMKHELSSIEKKPKGGFEFRLVILNGKATRETTASEIASDLLEMLKLSQTGSTLIAANRYEITLDKKQMLRISRQAAV